ncbi:hypothetical protein DFP72DRAFT_1135653 [Ephemerocybe angulata]|uniref:Uncharacterized protein n=1 Tax=Ephemerocybe angulata TaxID=980116 RepID=A0A8H6HSX9_9AGAR|nr:hypothetical protein DFP72DRAFT_1135653 [Tulosesus angulatus]
MYSGTFPPPKVPEIPPTFDHRTSRPTTASSSTTTATPIEAAPQASGSAAEVERGPTSQVDAELDGPGYDNEGGPLEDEGYIEDLDDHEAAQEDTLSNLGRILFGDPAGGKPDPNIAEPLFIYETLPCPIQNLSIDSWNCAILAHYLCSAENPLLEKTDRRGFGDAARLSFLNDILKDYNVSKLLRSGLDVTPPGSPPFCPAFFPSPVLSSSRPALYEAPAYRLHHFLPFYLLGLGTPHLDYPTQPHKSFPSRWHLSYLATSNALPLFSRSPPASPLTDVSRYRRSRAFGRTRLPLRADCSCLCWPPIQRSDLNRLLESKTAIHTSRESQDAITKIRLPAAVPSSKKKSAKSTVQKPTQSCLAPNFQIPPLPQPLISSVPSSSTKRKLDDITNLNTVHLALFTHNNSLDLSLGDSDSDSDDNTQCENPRNVVALPSTTLTTGSQSNFLEDTADRGLAAASATDVKSSGGPAPPPESSHILRTVADLPEWKELFRVFSRTYVPASRTKLFDSQIQSEEAFVKKQNVALLKKEKSLSLSFDGGSIRNGGFVDTVHATTQAKRVVLLEGQE